MYLTDNETANCCGCTSCQQICPAQCIEMKLLHDGFMYPVVDKSKCTNCGICLTVCPIPESKQNKETDQIHDCYYGWHNDAHVRHESTSGGAFSAIAELVLANKGFIYGATFDDKWHVCHMGIDKSEDLGKLRQSKYVQSGMGNCYSEIRDKLKRNQHILFCGTPCQVHGLRAFLKKNYTKLWLIDFICHGITSPHVFERYIQSLEKRENSKINKFRFRDKVTIGNFHSLAYTTIEFKNSKKKSSGINSFLMAYMKGLMQRTCCEACPYASLFRWSDVTIGDFWGLEEIVPEIKEEFHKGISMLITNTEKGKLLCSELPKKMQLVKTEMSYALNGSNLQLTTPVHVNNKKKQFYIDVNKMPVELALIKGMGVKSYVVLRVRVMKSKLQIITPRWVIDFKNRLSRKSLNSSRK